MLVQHAVHGVGLGVVEDGASAGQWEARVAAEEDLLKALEVCLGVEPVAGRASGGDDLIIA